MLVVEDLSVDYATADQPVRAVNGVSFAVPRGEIMVIVGESGSGKSSLGLSIPGLIGRSNGMIGSGSIRFDGTELVGLTEPELRRFRGARIAMIFQNPRASLNPVHTIGDQLVETLRGHDRSLDVKTATERGVELLRKVGIPDPRARMAAYPHQLSGGLCQRVMIALGISLGPRLLIADEPTSALDVTVKVQILQLLKQLSKELDMGVILITHDLGVARALADTVAVMYAGEIVEVGTAADVLDDPKMPYTQALFGSLPSLHGERRNRLPAIAGRPPNLSEPPSGCRFAQRCIHAVDRCRTRPVLVDIAMGHRARCHFPHDPALASVVLAASEGMTEEEGISS